MGQRDGIVAAKAAASHKLTALTEPDVCVTRAILMLTHLRPLSVALAAVVGRARGQLVKTLLNEGKQEK